ncbi:unnamed protein product, partial [Durusdinium trenchii]
PPIRTGQEIRHDSIIAQPGIPNGQPGGVQVAVDLILRVTCSTTIGATLKA